MLLSLGQTDWLQNVTSNPHEVEDDYHCDPFELLAKREDEDADDQKGNDQ